MSTLLDGRLDLFAFTSTQLRHTYLDILLAFDDARERSTSQLSPADVARAVEALDTADAAQSALDSLVGWGVLVRIQDDARVRTIAEYRLRRSVYQMTEIGWLAYQAVRGVMDASPGESELRRLVLHRVHQELESLIGAVRANDREKASLHFGETHRMLTDLSHHADRFLIATSELATTWELDPNAFIVHKRRLLLHLDGFLAALSSQRPRVAASLAQLHPYREQLIELVASTSAVEPALARRRAELNTEGIYAWFDDSTGRRSQATILVERMTRAIRDLTGLLRRVVDATSGGVSRARRLEELASWFIACPDDAVAHALAGVTSGLASVQHVGVVHGDLGVEPSTSWWDAPPTAVDTTLRKRGRASAHAPPKPLPDRRKAAEVLRLHQNARREQQAKAQRRLVVALNDHTPLDSTERAVLLRLLSRALHTRGPADKTVTSVHGRLRMTLARSSVDTQVPTTEGLLILQGMSLTLAPSTRAQP